MSSAISPVLFLDSNGEPMRFYIRPGPAKVQLRDVITAGGGCLCRVQEPGAILLIDPKETAFTDTSGQLYVSTQYILDCVEKNQQLDEMNYRLSPTPKMQTRSLRSKEGAVGRMAYTVEEDDAILSYISKHKTEARGNSVWQLMEKQKVTSHTWQSMKDRYLKHLQNKPAKVKMGMLEFVPTSKAQKDSDIPIKPCENENEPDPVLGADSAEVSEVAVGHPEVSGVAVDQPVEERPEQPVEERPEQPTEEALDEDGIAAPSTGQQTFGECPEGDMVAVPEEEHREPSPKKSRLDSDGIGGNQDISGPGEEENPDMGGLQSSKSSTPTKRRLGILDRAVKEFCNSLLIEDASQPPMTATSLSQSDSEPEIFHEAVEPKDTGLSPQSPKKSLESRCNGDATVASGESTKTCNAKLSSSRSHLFLLEGESQEEDFSQPSQQPGSAPQPVNTGEELVLSLMKDCNKTLLEVTKALLKTSGDITLAQNHLLQGTLSRPLWSQKEDQLLLSADPVSKCQLEKRHGKTGVSARMNFLQAQGLGI